MAKKPTKNPREILSFLIGNEEFNNKELNIILENLTPVFGSEFQFKNKGSVFVASKDQQKYETYKNLYFCCGCSEFIIENNASKIYLAFDL